jgi:hypothetical protein
MKKKWIVVGIVVVILIGIALIPVGGVEPTEKTSGKQEVTPLNLEKYSGDSPGRPLDMLFIHHSCGGQLLAPVGSDIGQNCIYKSHPNGGGLRDRLVSQGYRVHEVSYGSELGENTDLFDWLPKFSDKMGKVLTASGPDTYYSDDTKNNIVAFKSCYPNNLFNAEGTEPGNPQGPELTVANAKATYRELLNSFAKHTDVLFVAVTAPPLLGSQPAEPLLKHLARRILGKTKDVAKSGLLARQFNNWMKAENGWLKDYPHKNVVVFDYYDVLTGNGAIDFLKYPSGPNSNDNHPNQTGNAKAGAAYVPFLNKAVRRAGLVD